ncbi:MAG: HAD family phosphatase, partial [Leeuwenhoekiella sp.]
MIKNIIFDFGDVFINLDKKAPEYALAKVGVKVEDQQLFDLHDTYEKGLVTTETLIETYLAKFPGLSEISFKLAWNSIILDFPEKRLIWLQNLAKTQQYRLFLLSNTNDLHIEQVIKNMGAMRYSQFHSCFEKFYLSQQIKMRKPDLEIYDYVLTEN